MQSSWIRTIFIDSQRQRQVITALKKRSPATVPSLHTKVQAKRSLDVNEILSGRTGKEDGYNCRGKEWDGRMDLPLSPEIVPIGASKEEFGNATSILPCGLYEMFPAHRRALRFHSMTKAPSGLNACGRSAMLSKYFLLAGGEVSGTSRNS